LQQGFDLAQCHIHKTRPSFSCSIKQQGQEMTHVSHELHEEFPAEAEILHELKVSDPHFAKLADHYHEINREIHRIEAGIEAASDARTEDLKKERLSILDQVSVMISAAKAGVQA
jgi:uncharacterized protein YdcH (DUF465 family)